MIPKGREQGQFLSLPQSAQTCMWFSSWGIRTFLITLVAPKTSTTGRVIPKAAVAGPGAVGASFLEEAARFARRVLGSHPLPSLTGVQRGEHGARAGSPVASAAGHDQRLQLPDQLGHAVPVALGAAALQLALHLQVGAVRALRSHLRAGAVMGGAAEKWRPGRGRRPGWGAHAGGGGGGAGGGRGPGGSGGPVGGGRAAATAAAPSAPPGASGLGLRLRGPDASRSSLRLCCSSSWRCRRRRCCSCCHSPRPGPGRRQLRTRPWPRLHLRGGVARPRRAGSAGGQRGHSSQARDERSRPPRRQRQAPTAAAADSALTLMLRGAPAPGGASLPAPSPSHRGSWPGDPRPRRPGFVWWPRHQRCPRHVTNPGRGRPARRPCLRE